MGLLWVYAEMTLCDVNSKASLHSKMNRVPQPTYTSVIVEMLHVYEQVQGDFVTRRFMPR